VQKLLDDYQSGVLVTQVAMQNIAPPEATIDAFRDVQAASADKERSVNEAQAYFNEVTQRAGGQAQQIIKGAEAYKEQTVAIATGNAQRFVSVLDQYRKAREITQRRIYLETMEQVLRNMNKVLVGGKNASGTVPYLPLNELLKQQTNQAPPPPASAAATDTNPAPGANP
jgi:membrane protease subunit HflK